MRLELLIAVHRRLCAAGPSPPRSPATWHVLLLALACACPRPGRGAEHAIQLRDVTAETGIHFRHTDGSSGRYYMIEYVPVYPGPRDYPPDTHTLLRNNGDGTFRDVSVESGIAARPAPGMGMVCADYDDDGDTDIFVGNDASANFLFRNDGQGHFEDVGLLSGFAYEGQGNVQGTMGVECGDYDNDGRLDIHVTSYQNEVATLYRKLGNGKFTDITAVSGDGMQVQLSSRGAGFDDLDNDGDVDVVILNSRREPTILRNESRSGHHWIQLQLRGTKSNREGIGARVEVTAGDLTQVDEVHSGRGYQGHFGTRLHFGLGAHSRIDRIRVRWVGGVTQTLTHVPVDRVIAITQP